MKMNFSFVGGGKFHFTTTLPEVACLILHLKSLSCHGFVHGGVGATARAIVLSLAVVSSSIIRTLLKNFFNSRIQQVEFDE